MATPVNKLRRTIDRISIAVLHDQSKVVHIIETERRHGFIHETLLVILAS
jgi:hypothetical protein